MTDNLTPETPSVRPPASDLTFLAETNFRNQRRRFGIKRDDRRRHMYLIGKTGMGKSTVMENMITQDIVNGDGVALVDPHGDFAEKILDYIPPYRINDVVYFNPADMNFPIAFNVMEIDSSEHKHLIASGLVGVFKKLWADSWGPRLEYVLRNTILALLDYPGSSLLGVMRMLSDKNYRAKVIARAKDPVVRSFWVDEYARYTPQMQAEALAPIQNKVGQFLSTTLIRNVVGQTKSTIDIRKIMDERKILIMNLSKGRIGEDASALLGAMMITKIQLAAMSRIDIDEKKRQDFYLYVDEFQNFATSSFAAILSEARKYRLNLIIAHQYIEQLDELVRAAVFGNVGTTMCFRVGAGDAEFLVQEFAPYFEAQDLVNLAKYDVYMKLMIDGVASNPFSATTLPPLFHRAEEGTREKVIAASRERYAKPREVVEERISRWSSALGGDDEDHDKTDSIELHDTKPESTTQPQPPRPSQPGSPAAKPASQSRPNQPKEESTKSKPVYQVACYECGNQTEVHFKPDGIRPIYCPSCFKKVRSHENHGPEVDKSKLEEVIPESAPAISLEQALKQAPVVFKGVPAEPRPHKNNRPSGHPSNHNAQPKQQIQPTTTSPEIETAIKTQEQQPTIPPIPITTTPHSPKPSQPSQNISLKNVQPGQIVKF